MALDASAIRRRQSGMELFFMLQEENKRGRCTDNLAECHPIRTIGAPISIIPTIFMQDALPAATLPIYLGLGQAPILLGRIPSGLVLVKVGKFKGTLIPLIPLTTTQMLLLLWVILFIVQGLFAIVEFETEESAQKVLLHDEDVLFRGRRLIVKPRRTNQEVAAGTGGDNDNSGSVEQSAADFHCQLLSKLTSCSNVCISLLHS